MAKTTTTAKPADEPLDQWSKRFDARPDRLDLRDRPYIPPLRSLPAVFPSDEQIGKLLPAYVARDLVLDQGSEGACTGFGLACVANYLLFRREMALKPAQRQPVESVSARMLYDLARRYDEWPGEDYSGSSCRGAIKGWHKHGVCAESKWRYVIDTAGKVRFEPPEDDWLADAARRPLGVYYRVDKGSIVDLQAAIVEIGAVFVSAGVHDGWNTLLGKRSSSPRSHAALRVIPPKSGSRVGGHAFALVGYNADGFIVQNSWGARWGAGGFAVLPYADWIEHATDAWACALGAPMAESAGAVAPRYPLPSGAHLATWSLAGRSTARRGGNDDPYPRWSVDEARDHALISGDDGFLVRDAIGEDLLADPMDYVRRRVVDAPLAWFKRQPRGPVKLVLHAHGGLVSEDKAIDNARALAPVLAGNALYPLFLTWKTGPGETLAGLYEDWKRQLLGTEVAPAEGWFDALRDASRDRVDRSIEEVARRLGRSAWSEMRENALRGRRRGRVLDLLARALLELRDRLARTGRTLEIHVLGHSAGSILLGHLIDHLTREPDLAARQPRIASVTLLAAACSVRFACDTYLHAAEAGVLDLKRLHSYVLSDDNERDDPLPNRRVPLYSRSLLYLVSRALDDERNMPLLGLERAMSRAYIRPAATARIYWANEEVDALQRWHDAWLGSATAENAWRADYVQADGEIVVERVGGRVRTAPPSHGGYDQDLDVVERVLVAILGRPLRAGIPSLR